MDKKIQTLEANQQETVLKISRAISRTLDLKEILVMACQMAAQALKADRCSIGLLSSKDTFTIIHSYRKKSFYPSLSGAKFNLTNYPYIAPHLIKRKFVHTFDHKKIPLSLKEKKLFKQLNVKVFLAVPIIIDGKLFGSFHLSRVEKHLPFTPSEIKLCQTIANQVGIAIKNATLLKDLKERFDQQNIILDISKSLFQTLNLQKLFNLISQKTCQTLKMDRCTISTFEPGQKQGVIRSIYVSGKAKALVKGKLEPFHLGKRYALIDSTYIYRLLQRKKIFVTENILSLPLPPFVRKYARSVGTKSVLIATLNPKRKMSGILAVSSVERYHKFTDSEIKLCLTIANLASLAIENAKLMQDLQEKTTKIQHQSKALEKQYNEERILLEISKALSQTLDLKKLFKIVTRKTAELLGIERCAAMLIDENRGELIKFTVFINGKYQYGLPKDRSGVDNFPVILSQTGRKRTFYAPDVAKSAISAREKNYFRELGVKSVLDIPFVLKNRVLGILGVTPMREHHRFTDSEIRLCQGIANQLSIVIENARLVQDIQEKSEKIKQQAAHLEKQFKEERILLEISKALSQTFDLKKLFKIVTRKTAELTGIERCATFLIDEIKGELLLYTVFYDGKHKSVSRGSILRVEDFPGLLHQVNTKHLFCTSDVSRSAISPKEKRYFKKLDVKSVLNIPFVLAGRLLGVLALNTVRECHNYTESEIRLGQAIANQLSVAIENARLMQEVKNKTIKIEHQTNILEKQFKEQSILLEISKALAKTLDLAKLFRTVTKKTADLLRTERCAVILLDEVKETLVFHKVYSEGKHRIESEGVQRNFKDFPNLVAKLKKEQIFYTSKVSGSILSSVEKQVFEKDRIKSLLIIPFYYANKVQGLLVLSSLKKQRQFKKSEIKLCQAIANQLSVAVENARLMELTKKHSSELENLSLKIIDAQEKEKKNIAGKLHDVITQDLTAIQLNLKMCQQILPEPDDQIKAKLKESSVLATQSLENLRNLTSDLRPPVLDHFGLASAINWYVDSFRRRTNIKIDLKISELTSKLSPEFETTIYRIIQESLTNVAKHSQANRVSISFYQKGNNSRILIKDNGIGFDSYDKSSFNHGFGLFRLKENAELLGGKFKIISKIGRGTKLDITLPCKEVKQA